MIESENQDAVEINLGYGTTTFHRSEIDRIVRSDPKAVEAIWQRWGEDQKVIEKRKPEEDQKWRNRQSELDRLRREADQLKKDQDETAPKTIHSVAKNGQMLMNVLLNGKVRVKLVLDSGAGIVVLTRRVADKLELDVEKLKKSKIQVADGRYAETGLITLESFKVENAEPADADKAKKPGVEIKNVESCVLLEELPDQNKAVDGLLGMSFLRNFKFNADYNNGTVIFEKIKEGIAPGDQKS